MEPVIPPGGCPAEVLDVLRWFAGEHRTPAEIVIALRVRQEKGFAKAYPLPDVEAALRLLAAAGYVVHADDPSRYSVNVTKPAVPTDPAP